MQVTQQDWVLCAICPGFVYDDFQSVLRKLRWYVYESLALRNVY